MTTEKEINALTAGQGSAISSREFEPRTLVDFKNLRIGTDSPESIVGIDGKPVLPQLAELFGFFHQEAELWTVEELGMLIRKIGPAKELQKNIPLVQEVLSDVDGHRILVELIRSSGLLEPVFRNFENPVSPVPDTFDHAVITGGVRNWMMRRAKLLIDLTEHFGRPAARMVRLVAGNDGITGPDVLPGETQARYQERVIKPLLENAGYTVVCSPVNSGDGEVVASAVADNCPDGNILVLCTAGNWLQNGGQIRRAVSGDEDRVFVVSDEFPLDVEGGHPPVTHQNPATAVGMLARALQEIQRFVRNGG